MLMVTISGIAAIAVVGRIISGEVSVAMKAPKHYPNYHVNVKVHRSRTKRISVQEIGVSESIIRAIDIQCLRCESIMRRKLDANLNRYLK